MAHKNTNEVEVVDGRHLRSIATRKKILAAGGEVFLSVGFQKATISQIIKKAKTGYGTAYIHFTGKDDLLVVLMEDVMSEFFTIAHTPFFPKTKEEAKQIIYNQVLRLLQLADSEKNMMRVFAEAIGLSAIVSAKWEEIRKQFIESITRDITYGQNQGLIRTDMKPEVAARGWFYSNEMYQWEIVKDNKIASLEEIATTLTNMYTDGLYV